jgi:hypothetical protein
MSKKTVEGLSPVAVYNEVGKQARRMLKFVYTKSSFIACIGALGSHERGI